MALIIKSNTSSISRLKKEYFAKYPKMKEKLEQTASDKIITLLKNNPNISGKDLAYFAGCSNTAASKIKRKYLGMETKKRCPQSSEQQIIIFTLLNKNPKLLTTQIAQLANCNVTTANKWKKAWLQQQTEQEEPPDDTEAPA